MSLSKHPSSDQVLETTYSLSRYVGEILDRGLVACTAYGELRLTVEESQEVGRLIAVVLRRRLANLNSGSAR